MLFICLIDGDVDSILIHLWFTMLIPVHSTLVRAVVAASSATHSAMMRSEGHFSKESIANLAIIFLLPILFLNFVWMILFLLLGFDFLFLYCLLLFNFFWRWSCCCWWWRRHRSHHCLSSVKLSSYCRPPTKWLATKSSKTFIKSFVFRNNLHSIPRVILLSLSIIIWLLIKALTQSKSISSALCSPFILFLQPKSTLHFGKLALLLD
jgi:hypothetical protein